MNLMENINRGFERKYGSILESCDKNKKKVEECDKVQECDKKPSSKKELQESPIKESADTDIEKIKQSINGLTDQPMDALIYPTSTNGKQACVKKNKMSKGKYVVWFVEDGDPNVVDNDLTIDQAAEWIKKNASSLNPKQLKKTQGVPNKEGLKESCARGRRKSIRELLEEISPEDQHDSDLLRSAILKSRDRKNASLTKDEKDVLNKYDLTRVGGNIYRKGKEHSLNYKLDRDVDSSYFGDDFIDPETSNRTTRELSKRRDFPRGIDKVNLADRARKLGTRDYTKTVGDVIVGRDASKNNDYTNTSWRSAEARSMKKPYVDTRNALLDIEAVKSGRGRAQRYYDLEVANAKRRFDSATSSLDSREQRANDIIDKNLKRGKYAPATESFRRKRIKEAGGVEIDDTFDEINAFLQGGEFEKTTRPGMKGRSRIKGIVDYRQIGVTRDGDIKVRVEDEDRAEEVENAILDKFGDVVEIERKKDKYDDNLPINIIIKIVGGEVIDDIDKKFKSKNESIGSDVAEYQKWVDYDMKRYKKISDKTMSKIKKAGLSVVKDQYGDYEVIAKEPIREAAEYRKGDIITTKVAKSALSKADKRKINGMLQSYYAYFGPYYSVRIDRQSAPVHYLCKKIAEVLGVEVTSIVNNLSDDAESYLDKLVDKYFNSYKGKVRTYLGSKKNANMIIFSGDPEDLEDEVKSTLKYMGANDYSASSDARYWVTHVNDFRSTEKPMAKSDKKYKKKGRVGWYESYEPSTKKRALVRESVNNTRREREREKKKNKLTAK